MSTASVVPETRGLAGRDAWTTLKEAPSGAFARDALVRLRSADGFSHSRATAFQVVLTMIPGAIVLVAAASVLRWETLSTAVANSAESLAPGRASSVLRDAVQAGKKAGHSSNWAAIIGGSLALLVAGTTVFGQIERTGNRIYGVESDRPSVVKYARAFLMLLSAGTLVALYFLTIGVGGGVDIESSLWSDVWNIVRWPLGAVLITVAYCILYRMTPRRQQPEMQWLLAGALVAMALTMLASTLLKLYLQGSGSFGDTYGPLAGFLGLMLWAYACVTSMYVGLAVAAQLEAVRAGRAEPRSDEKVELGEPDAVAPAYGAALAGVGSDGGRS